MFPTFADQPAREKDNAKPAMQKLDGDWTVTYIEVDGKKLEGKEFTQVTIKNNVVTCKHDGKEKSWRLEFGPHNMVRCTAQIDGKTISEATKEKRDPSDKSECTHFGHYIASQEYFCLCMNKGRDQRSVTGTEPREGEQPKGERGSTPRFGEQGAYGAHFVLILHRSGSTTPSSK